MATFRVRRNSALGLPSSRSRDYVAWAGMVARCTNPRSANYPAYGGRGITICERWRKFANFYADMGKRPEGVTLGRIDNNGPYSPENCRWETNAQQADNTKRTVRVFIDGTTKTLTAWCRDTGVPARVARDRIRLGWHPALAVSTPVIEGVEYLRGAAKWTPERRIAQRERMNALNAKRLAREPQPQKVSA